MKGNASTYYKGVLVEDNEPGLAKVIPEEVGSDGEGEPIGNGMPSPNPS